MRTRGDQLTSSVHSQCRFASSPRWPARMFITMSTSSNSNRCGTSASRSRGPISGSSLISVNTLSITSLNSFDDENGLAITLLPCSRTLAGGAPARASQRRQLLVGAVLFVCLAVRGSVPLLLGARVVDDAKRRMLVGVRGVLDQLLLAQLKALRLAAARLLDGLALFATALDQLEQRIRPRLRVHGADSTYL